MFSFTRSWKIPGAGAAPKQAGSETQVLTPEALIWCWYLV